MTDPERLARLTDSEPPPTPAAPPILRQACAWCQRLLRAGATEEICPACAAVFHEGQKQHQGAA